MPRVWDVPVRDSTRVRDARVAAEQAAALAGLDERRTASAALVATELATNLLKHAEDGQVLVDVVAPPDLPAGRDTPRVVQIAAIDHGPGIADVARARRDGFSTAGSLGAGLGTCLRIADAFDLHSTPGRGTVALARIGLGGTVAGPSYGTPRGVRGDGAGAVTGVRTWSGAPPETRGDGTGALADVRPSSGAACGTRAGGTNPSGPPHGARAGGVNVPLGAAEYSGDAWAWVRSGDLLTLMLADGLGHGPEAARASTAAVGALRETAGLPPGEVLRRLDRALSGTRGAAVAVARVDTRVGRLRFAGVGNVGARLCEDGTWRHLTSRPGIIGVHRHATLREEETGWGPGRLLIMHTDGLPSRWTPPSDARLWEADPAVTAAVTIRDAGSRARPVRDDTAVAVLSAGPVAP